MKKLLFVAGGSGGHITPVLAIADEVRKQDTTCKIVFISSHSKLDNDIFSAHPYTYKRISISTGKLRRYFSLQNIGDFFRFLKGILDAYILLRKEEPDMIFLKGGYVSLPVGIAARLQNISFTIHESDSVSGLANRILHRLAARTLSTFPTPNALHVGTPIRKNILSGETERGRRFLKFSTHKPIILIMGGSQGAETINQLVIHSLAFLRNHANVVHISGKGKSVESPTPAYRHFSYLGEEFGDVLWASDIVISRAGANSLFEIAAAQKPVIIIPLPSAANNHQVKNAEFFKQCGAAKILLEEDLTSAKFQETILKLLQNQNRKKMLAKNIALLTPLNSAKHIAQILLSK